MTRFPILLALASIVLAPSATARPPARQAGQVLETFETGAGEDPTVFRRDERAIWGRGGVLTATTHFPGTGGPGGDFDWVIQAGQTFVLDTSFSVITNAQQTATQNVVNGNVDVRDLWVQSGATLVIRGPNGCRIAASGDVRIDGRIDGKGVNHPGVVTLNTGLPSPGASGGPGGGRGGDASAFTTQSTPIGSPGRGPFGTMVGGGGGGESAFNASPNVEFRRPAGGGGGRFAADQVALASGCPDQQQIGLDAERGGPGAPQANGAIGGVGVPPVPGAPGTGPFLDGDPTNDFWGRMILPGGSTVVGELTRPWAGAGGGGGGNAAQTSSWPTTPWNPTLDETGSGGGGGGGSLVVYVLGDFVLGSAGRIDVSGGTGGGGENTLGINRVGGGSGGGSGGHLVLQVGGVVDLRACVAGATIASGAGLFALGGQGGEGRNGIGGAGPGGVATPPGEDSINLAGMYPPACLPPATLNFDVICSGGDGGPGVIQIHVRSLDRVLPPSTGANTIAGIVMPRPVGTTESTVDTPLAWQRLDPMFGPHSFAQSRWSALPASAQHDLRFAGTGAGGLVTTNGSGPNARVPSLPPIASGAIAPAPAVPHISPDGRRLLIAASSVTDDVWVLNAALLEFAEIAMQQGSSVVRYDVEAAQLAAMPDTLVLVTVDNGVPLAGTSFSLSPRMFRVATDGIRDWLPGSASIRIQWQGAPATPAGGVDESQASAWVADVNALEGLGGLSFLRFRVGFDMATSGADIALGEPRPVLEFLRLVTRY